MISLKMRRKRLFQLKMKLAERKRSNKLTTTDLEEALSQLINNKSRDNDGYINDIFKKDIIGAIGDDLKKSLLVLCNNLKKRKLLQNL